MRIAVAQLDPVVGAFEANVKKIQEAYERACQAQARLLLTPEMGVCGYPPYDLIERPEMFERNEKALADLAAITRGKQCALLVGHVSANPSAVGRAAQNVATIFEDGKAVFRQAKSLLPTYDVFDEARYFEPAAEIQPWICDGVPVAVAICEDLWAEDPTFKRRLYGRNPVDRYRELGVRAVVSISSSPYEWGKRERRESLHADVARALSAPLVYVNQTGATDEILFDGASFAMSERGELLGRLPAFQAGFGILELEAVGSRWDSPVASGREDEPPSEIEVLSRALVVGIKEYFARTGFKTAIVGLSGGIDSSVVGVLAARALGPQSVLGVGMPSQVSSPHSLEDAEALAKNLGIHFEVRPIKFLYSTAAREFAERRGELASVALENLQSRLRGIALMTLANHYSALVVTTGNKSELATGYCTLYGDMVGALAPLGDIYKTRVYELARYLNQAWGNPIPARCLTKPPSAELRPGQLDQDSLPAYEFLDRVLEDYLEKGVPVAELERKYGPQAVRKTDTVQAILRKIEVNEYKRRQAAPVLKVSHKAFGIGRRVPLAKDWDQDRSDA